MVEKQDLDGLVSKTCTRGNRMGVIALIQILDEIIEQKLWAGLINRIPAMAVYIRPCLGGPFYGGVSPSKISPSAPYLERTQLRSKARVFLYT
jgi:hypothetical protein